MTGKNRDRRRRFYKWATATAVVVSWVALPVLAGTLDDPYRSDPLGLVAHYDMTSDIATGSDSYEVWVCDPVGRAPESDDEIVVGAVRLLDDLTGSYWTTVSTGKYRVSFEPGGVVSAGHPRGCVGAARERSAGEQAAALVFSRTLYPSVGFSGWGTTGVWCYDSTRLWWCRTAFPTNGRYAIVEMSVTWGLSLSGTVHEMGHTFGMPHSFTGLLSVGDPRREYDNLMDVMSGGGQFVAALGTIAPNRYAAGWFGASSVRVFGGGTERVVLDSAPSSAGVQMLVVPSGTVGVWLGLGARTFSAFDQVPKEGVEAYVIDQTGEACGQAEGVCWGPHRRTAPFPVSEGNRLAHVLGPGEGLVWNGVTVTVEGRSGGEFTVLVTDGTTDWFVDDNGNTHEQDINRIAQLGITQGCSTNPPRFCPDQSVTRAEMATFILRTLNMNPTANRTLTFSDVPEGKWYADYVHAFAETGVDMGHNGMWRPTEPLTRLEMAQWLTTAFGHINPTAPTGLFADVEQGHWATVEGLYHTQITRGCSTSPLRYCPDQPVTRAQMASFLTRTLNTRPK